MATPSVLYHSPTVEIIPTAPPTLSPRRSSSTVSPCLNAPFASSKIPSNSSSMQPHGMVYLQPSREHGIEIPLSGAAASSTFGYDLPLSQTQETNYPVYQQLYPRSSNDAFSYVDQIHLTPNPTTGANYALDWSPMDTDYSCPRSHANMDFMGSAGLSSSSYPPSMYEEPASHPTAFTYPSPEAQVVPSQVRGLCDLDNNFYMPFENQYPVSGYPSRYPSPGMTSPVPHYSGPSTPASGRTPDHFKIDTLDDQNVDKEEPYAKLIFRCLLKAKDHTMVLRDIYNWFTENTDKGKDKDARGWQNSIRHNLSMNAAFQKVDPPPGVDITRRGFLWKLTNQAIAEGVKSTTRFRSKHPTKRPPRSNGHRPDPQRQASGARGGAAAKKAAILRRSERLRDSHVQEHLQEPDWTTFEDAVNRQMANHSSGVVPSIETSTGPSSPYFLASQSDNDNGVVEYPTAASSATCQPRTRYYTPGLMHEDSPTSMRGNPSVLFADLGNKGLVYSSEEPMTPESCGWGFEDERLFDPLDGVMTRQ